MRRAFSGFSRFSRSGRSGRSGGFSRFGRLTGLTAAVLLAFTVAQPSQAQEPKAAAAPAAAVAAAVAPAYFEVTTYGGHPAQPFILKLVDEDDIEHARELVSGRTDDRPHIVGRIVPSTAPYNPGWSFHFDPRTVDFFNYAIEVCDATFPYVEEHLDEAGGAFLPGRVLCPWSSKLVREVPAPDAQ